MRPDDQRMLQRGYHGFNVEGKTSYGEFGIELAPRFICPANQRFYRGLAATANWRRHMNHKLHGPFSSIA